MPYKSKKQQGLFNLLASKSKKFAKLATEFNKATYKGKGGGKSNKKKFSSLPVKVKKKRK